jgi:hypothetical protein
LGINVTVAKSESIQLLRHDPDLAEFLVGDRLQQASRDLVARIIGLEPGNWTPLERIGDLPKGLGLLVLEGLIIRRVGLGGRYGSELLGDGDLLRPCRTRIPGPCPYAPGAGRCCETVAWLSWTTTSRFGWPATRS